MPDFLWPAILLLIGLGIVMLELMIPSGGVLSAIAGITILASIIVAFTQGGVALGTTFMAITCALIPTILILFVRIWPNTPMGKRVLIKPPPADELVPEEVQSLKERIGQRGKALTPMLPSGAIRLGRQTIDAISEGMTIEAGTPVEVVSAKGNHLVVRPVDDDEPNPPDGDQDRELDAIVPDPFDDSLP